MDAGRDVVVLCEGDPFFYGSYMYLHERLSSRYETEVVPGVTSFSAAAAAAGVPLVKRDDVLTVLPATLSEDELAVRLRGADAAVVMKLGRTFPPVARAAEAAGVASRAVWVAHASSSDERVAALRDVDAAGVPYMSLVLVPSVDSRVDAGAPGRVAVVGLGPAGAQWLTPEAAAELAEASVDRRLQDLCRSRAAAARAAAPGFRQSRRGRAGAAGFGVGGGGRASRGGVVGRPGDIRDGGGGAGGGRLGLSLVDVEVRVVPGLSAMQAAAARVGRRWGTTSR